MKGKRKLLYFILLIVVISGLTGFSTFHYGAAAKDSSEIIRERLNGAVAIYSGSMFSLVNNNLQVIDPENELITPFIQDNRMLVPIRFIAESFGAKVSWDQAANAAAIVMGNSTVIIKINSTEMTINGKTVALDVPAMITGDRTFIPLRAVSEVLGKKVYYDRGLVVISSTADIFHTDNEKNLIDSIIDSVNILPIVGSREKLVGMLEKTGGPQIAYDDIRTVVPAQKAAAAAPTSNSQVVSGESSPNYSNTNVQVEGVDEADIVKTDGEYIYQVSNGKVLIYKAYPADDMALAGTISYTDGQFTPIELYIYQDKLVVIGSTTFNSSPLVSEPAQKVRSIYPIYQETATKAFIYDVSDKSKPVNIREVSLAGNYVSSRLIADDLYVVSNQNIYNWQDSSTPLNPQYKDTAVSTDTITIPYDDIKYILPVVNSSYLLVAGLSLDEPTRPSSVETYLGAGNEIYVSLNNLYIAVNEGYGGIRPMRMTGNGLMPPQTQEATLIYKFLLKDAAATYQARGQVPGRILNQFSMDENDGDFRIATTFGNSWMTGADTSSNNVYILDSNLNVTGKLEDMAKGEKIYSVRFMGDRAYVVTFKTVDPLFVIDLADSWNPAVLGALKIPGYSDYLHPYDENHIIGFGKDTMAVPVKDSLGNEIGTTAYYLGMKVALFDVSDVSNPIEKYTVKIGDRGTESELLHDHKALLFDKEKQLLAFPVNEAKVDGPVLDPRSNVPNYGRTIFNGAYVYHLNLEEGFVLKGKISHTTSEDYLKSSYYEVDYNKQIRRLLLIDSVLYGVSNSEISAHDMDNLQKINSVFEK